jgi:hypothetical protein
MARSEIETTSSATRRPFGKPARSPPRRPNAFASSLVGGMAVFRRSMSACTSPVLFWKSSIRPSGMPVSRIATRSARAVLALFSSARLSNSPG